MRERLRDCDAFILDMDGTIYVDERLLPGARELLDLLAARGHRRVFVTNNSSRRGATYRERLARLGIEVDGDAVLTSGDAMIDQYLAGLTESISKRPLNGIASRQQWEAERPRLRREYLDMLGLWPLPERTPLHATVTGTLERPGVVIEKLHYQSRPGLYVTANLYRPAKPQGKLPAVLYVCGHSGRGRDGNKTAF